MKTLALKFGDKAAVLYNGTEPKMILVPSLPNPCALTIGSQSYDGSEEVSVDLPTAFHINLTSDESGNYTKDKTMAEIQSAYEAGRPLYCNLTISGIPIVAALASYGTIAEGVPYAVFSSISHMEAINGAIAMASVYIVGDLVSVQSSNVAKNTAIPTKVSQLENDSNYALQSELPKAFYVEYFDGKLNKSLAEIGEAYKAGSVVFGAFAFSGNLGLTAIMTYYVEEEGNSVAWFNAWAGDTVKGQAII
jgi:hypothetical protein